MDSFSTNVKEISLAGDHLKKRSPYSMKYWLFSKDPGSLYWVIIIPIYLGSYSSPTNPLTRGPNCSLLKQMARFFRGSLRLPRCSFPCFGMFFSIPTKIRVILHPRGSFFDAGLRGILEYDYVSHPNSSPLKMDGSDVFLNKFWPSSSNRNPQNR